MLNLSREEWERLEALLDAALDLPPAERASWLDAACGSDLELRRLAGSLMESADRPDSFLEGPVDACAPGLLREIAEAGSDPVDPARSAGTRVGPYRLVRELGRGGMGTVYLADRDDEQYNRRVAIKVVRSGPLDGELSRLFLLERRILGSLEHPNIARLYNAGFTADDTPWFAMEYVAGRRIDEWCDGRRLPVRERLALFDQVCAGVEYAHQNLVVHRDLKPGNILVRDDGVVKLLDFGIARLVRTGLEENTGVTNLAGLHAMTPEYASPEQLRGEPVSTATDVYALGVLLFELLTGDWPYRPRDRSASSLERAVLEQDPANPSDAVTRTAPEPATDPSPSECRATTVAGLRRQLRGDLDNIVRMALSKDSRRRYASVQQLRDDVRRYRESRPVSARPTTWRYRAARFVRRNRLGVAGTTVVTASLIAGVAGTLWQARAASREARRADRVRDFVVGLFENAAPDRARGDSVTVRSVLDRGTEQLRATGLESEPATRADMLAVLGRLYQQLGLYDRALPLLEEALDVRRARLGDRDPDVVQSTADLASLLYDRGEYDRAEPLAREALEIRRDEGEDSLVARAMSSLASVLDARGEYEQADSLFRAGLTLDRRLGNRRLIAGDLENLGVAYWRQGKYTEALPLAEEALAMHRALYGDEHTEVATSLLNVATILMASGEYARAESMLRECLAMRRKLLGDRHPFVALTLSNLGQVLQQEGRLAAAEKAYREALEIRREAFGDDHMDVASSLNDLGVVRYFQGDPAGAAKQFEQALAIWRRALGESHPTVLTGMNNLGAARRVAGDLDGAERVLRETLALRRKALGDEHPDVAQSLNNLADVLTEEGNRVEAEADYRAAISTWRAALGADHPTVAFGLLGLGRLLLDRRRYAEAEPPLHEALELRLAKLDTASYEVASARLALARCLIGLHRHAEAEPLLLASYPVLVQRRGADDAITQRARRTLVALYTDLGRPADAARYR